MQLVNNSIAWLTGEVPQQRLTGPPAFARDLVFRGAERPYLAARRRVRCLKRPAAQNEAETCLAHPGVSNQHDLGVHIVDRARYRGTLRVARQDVEVEIVK